MANKSRVFGIDQLSIKVSDYKKSKAFNNVQAARLAGKPSLLQTASEIR